MDNPNVKQYLDLILASIPDGIITCTTDLVISTMNPAAESLAGISSFKCIGKPVEIVFPKDPNIRQVLKETMSSIQSFVSHDYSYTDRHGGRFHLSLVAACLTDPKGLVIGLVLILRDITTVRLLEEGLRRKDKLAIVGTLAAGMAHEIKNPLGGVRGSAQLLQERIGDQDQIELLDIIIKEVDRINFLVQELLDLARPRDCVFSPSNIHQILDDVLRLMEKNLRDQNIRVNREFDPSLPPLKVDPTRIQQVFLNLLSNAMDAISEGGDLTVATQFILNFHSDRPVVSERRSGMVLIEFKDTGAGLEESDAERLFTPFFTTKKSGSGLGLAVSYKIVQEHGGTIELINRNDGPGCSAQVYLPIWQDKVDGQTVNEDFPR